MTRASAAKQASLISAVTQPFQIRQLYISAGHNYFGHHDQEPGVSANVAVSTIECVAGSGIRGDRFFNYREDYKGQITFFSLEVLRDVCATLAIPVVSPAAVRRNVITEGIDLNLLIGRQFTIQDVLFEGVCECKPCYWMDRAITPGAEQQLKGRGGLRARILTSGRLVVPTPS